MSEDAFVEQLRVVEKTRHQYSVVMGEAAIESAYRDVPRAPVHIAGRELLATIERLKEMAHTDEQRQRAARIDEVYGGMVRRDEALAAETDAIVKSATN